MRTAAMVALIITFALTSPADAGMYSTSDQPEETRLSRDYENVFRFVLGALRTISDKKPDREPPMRKRYLLMEALGRQGAADLTSLEDQLNYSVVLIRRGKADEAVQFLIPIAREHEENFIVQSHFATAHFQASTDELRGRAGDIMEAALRSWPERWDNVEKEQKQFLEKKLGWEQGLFDQHRKYEVYFHKLIKHRRKKKSMEQPVDPIFDDGAREAVPVKFLDEDGKFAVGRIAGAEKAKLPPDAIEIVEQLLVWMPNDVRLLRLLAEVFNAAAMEPKADKNELIVQASLVMNELNLLLRNDPDIKARHDALSAHVAKMPRRNIPLENLPNDDPKSDSILSKDQFWRTLIVGLITGLAVGMFALWQVQEMRRRRQARISGGGTP